MDATVVKLRRFEARGSKGEAIEVMNLITAVGIEDNYIQSGEKQVCLFTEEGREWMEGVEEKGLCFMRFSENILVKDLDEKLLPIGTIVSIGSALLKVTAAKPCFNECVLFNKKVPCMLSRQAKFLVVESGGSISLGDSLTIVTD